MKNDKALIDITPRQYKCGDMSPACPAILESEAHTFVIMGKTIVRKEEKSVFVSHSTKDREWVEKRVLQFLRQSGFSPWYAREQITSASQWEREILKGMEACDWFSLVVSPASADSEWVKDELFWAMQHRPARIVPIIKEHSDLYKFHIRLPRIEHVDFTEKLETAERKLISCLNMKR